VKTLRTTRIVRAAVVGLMSGLAACSLVTGPHSDAGATFSGTVSSSQGGGIASATVTVTPAGAAALGAVETNSSGGYTVDSIPAGSGTVTVSNLPAACESTAQVQYTGAKNGGSRTLNVTVSCSSSTELP
jgi:Carboxypeptidase regulatory-like domain